MMYNTVHTVEEGGFFILEWVTQYAWVTSALPGDNERVFSLM